MLGRVKANSRGRMIQAAPQQNFLSEQRKDTYNEAYLAGVLFRLLESDPPSQNIIDNVFMETMRRQIHN
jgi:hypothetical protein